MGEDFKPESYKDKTIIKDADIIRRSGYWVLTEIQVYKKALETYMRWWKYDLSKGNKFSNRGNYPVGHLSKDPLEVYIESIQKEKCRRRLK